ncbi:MAG TPA: hypothetical protein VFQ61_22710 [Polyangiaceae bacterium]|nr:hypothetical protein [Polyangiaceae bacterium]
MQVAYSKYLVHRSSFMALTAVAALSLAACSSTSPSPLGTGGMAGSVVGVSGAGSGGTSVPNTGAGGTTSSTQSSPTGSGGVSPTNGGSPAQGGAAAGGAAAGGAVTAGMGGAFVAGATGMPTAGAASGAGGGAPGGSGGSAGAGTGGAHPMDHCLYGYDPEPTDATMKDGPAEFFPVGKTDPNIVDTTLQPEVISWMEKNRWQEAHVEWHAIRGCSVPGGGGLSKVNICSYKQLVPKDQNCQTEGDGYQFLMFHRHMMIALKQLWPKHTEQFEGFKKFPTSAEDVPPQWRSQWKNWDADVLAAGKLGDEIDKPENLAKFPSEGALGFWLQCNVGQKLASVPNMPFVGLHFVLHAKWARPGNTRHGVNNTDSNIDNYMFYKLHGWIDNVWEKYRRAKGLTQEDAKYKADLLAQCREMDSEIEIIKKTKPLPTDETTEPLPVESGDFHTKVRPIFEKPDNLCAGCHAETGSNAGLILGGNISSKKIVEGLVNKPSRDGGQFKLVAPGDPDHSWLYLKAAGKAEGAGCTPASTAQCITGVMPQNASGLPTVTAAELQTLRQWILDGAKGPT